MKREALESFLEGSEIEIVPFKPPIFRVECRDCETIWPEDREDERPVAEIIKEHELKSPGCQRFYFPPINREQQPNVSP